MIQQTNAEQASSLATHYADKGLSVIAKPRTVLSEMVRLTNVTGVPYYNQPVEEHSTEGDAYIAAKLNTVSAGTMALPSDHDLFVDKTADQIAKAVLAHISFAKNTVKPVVLDVGAAIDKAMQSVVVENPATTITVCELNTPALVDDMGLSQELARYNKASIIVPDSGCAHGDKTYEEILPLLMTGEQDTDEAIGEWYGSLEPTWVAAEWGRAFAYGTSQPTAATNDDVFTRLNSGIFLYLLGRRLMEDTTHLTEKIMLGVYKEKMAQIRDWGGALAMNSLDRVKAYDRTNVVVLKVDTYKKVCHVHAPNYRKWLANGGKPEVLLGMVVSGEFISQGSDLLEAGPKLLNVWNSYVSYSSTNSALQRFEAFKTSAALAVRDSYSTTTEQEKQAWKDIPNFEEKAAKLLEGEIVNLTSVDMQDPYSVAVKLVCRTRFFYTEAEQILTGIEAVMKENPNIEPREAAAVSVLLYVADYIADQMVLSV